MVPVSRSLWKHADQIYQPVINAEGVYICHFDPSFPIEVAFDIHDIHHGVRMNRHDSFEVMCVYEGGGVVQVRDRRFPIKRGSLVTVGPNLYHQIFSRSRMKLSCVHFKSELLLGSTGGEDAKFLAPFLCQDSRFPHVIPPSSGVPSQALELILKIHKELPPANDVARLAAKTYLKMLLLLLLRHYNDYVGTHEALERRQRDLQCLAPIFQFIDQSYGQSIRIVDAARICAMSKVHFMRFFKKVSGQSFLNYLTRYRTARAQLLLSTTATPIAEVSAVMGFCSQSHFGRTFKTLVGLTPLAYRRRFGKNLESGVDKEAKSPAS